MAEAIAGAQRRQGGMTQGELAAKVGCGREILSHSKSGALESGRDYPRKAIGLATALRICELAGWGKGKIDDMAVAFVQEQFWRSQRDHYQTIEMLPDNLRTKRWRQLGLAFLAEVRGA